MQATQYVPGQVARPQQLQVQPVQTQQLAIGDLLNQIMPIIVLVMMMGILMPMMRQMGQAFSGD